MLKKLGHGLRWFVVFLCVPCTDLPAQSSHWIWGDGDRQQNEVVYLRKSFSIPNPPESAKLITMADFAEAMVYCNGQRIATVEDYGPRLETDLTRFLQPGPNLLAVQARGSTGPSAFAAHLILQTQDETSEFLGTDKTWRTAPFASAGWEQADFADDDWKTARGFGTVLETRSAHPSADVQIRAVDDYTQWKQALGTEAGTNPSSFSLVPGFEIQLLRSAHPDEGSWLSMAFDPQGRLLVSKESKGLLRLTLPEEPAVDGQIQVELINDTLEECRGLLFAHGSLYANANNSKGLYRLRDTNGDDHFDEVRLLYASSGGVGHGRNDLTLGPDGWIYSIHGDSVDLPAGVHDRTSPWREARRGMTSHEGHVIRIDPTGRQIELVVAGLRNPYGIDFHADGEMFTYDADAEFDMGSPWYRPTRVQHLLPGGDFGWRGVTKQWPPYFPDHPDAAPPLLDIGKGSPTAVQFGTDSHFPLAYREALFVLDWAYGRILAVHLTPRGASYVGRAETFLRGKPLNVTDVTFGPDGAMYFVTGGRQTQSGLYRVRYVGDSNPRLESFDASTTEQQLARAEHAIGQRQLRRQLESLHGNSDSKVVAEAWPYLDSPDPWLRHAARVAIEHQPVSHWQDRALSETKTWGSLTGLLALAGNPDSSIHDQILARLKAFPWDKLSPRQQLVVLRIYELCLQRMNEVDPSTRGEIAQHVDALYPHEQWIMNRELSRLLAQLKSPTFVAKTMELLDDATEQAQQLHYLFVLRHAQRGWTMEQRHTYFGYFRWTSDYIMGEGMQGFLRQIQDDARASLSASERAELEPLLADLGTSEELADATAQTRAFVQEWSVEQIDVGIEGNRDLERGKQLFRDALCIRCHRLGSQGRAVGPDLSSVSSRFSPRDILQSIITPSQVVAEQYRKDVIETADGRLLVGSVIVDGDYRSPKLRISTDPLAPNQVVEIAKSNIVSHTKSAVSQMPTGLLDTLTHDEILDLLAYIAQGG